MSVSQGSLTNAIAYLDFMDTVLTDAAAAEDAITALRTAYPAYNGQALLNFINFRFLRRYSWRESLVPESAL